MSYVTVTEIASDESRLRVVLVRQALRTAGLAAMLLAGALAASLVTWNVDDPSFSYAAESPVHNLLGRPGAIFADLAMQFFGLAVVGLLFPFALFGWSLFRLRLPRWPLRQLLAWLGGAVLLSGALACLPISAKWPLP